MAAATAARTPMARPACCTATCAWKAAPGSSVAGFPPTPWTTRASQWTPMAGPATATPCAASSTRAGSSGCPRRPAASGSTPAPIGKPTSSATSTTPRPTTCRSARPRISTATAIPMAANGASTTACGPGWRVWPRPTTPPRASTPTASRPPRATVRSAPTMYRPSSTCRRGTRNSGSLAPISTASGWTRPSTAPPSWPGMPSAAPASSTSRTTSCSARPGR
ncbi:hypothetical protein D3C87_1303470 [compost metagenome]